MPAPCGDLLHRGWHDGSELGCSCQPVGPYSKPWKHLPVAKEFITLDLNRTLCFRERAKCGDRSSVPRGHLAPSWVSRLWPTPFPLVPAGEAAPCSLECGANTSSPQNRSLSCIGRVSPSWRTTLPGCRQPFPRPPPRRRDALDALAVPGSPHQAHSYL